jgi:hypothetical protein
VAGEEPFIGVDVSAESVGTLAKEEAAQKEAKLVF